MWTVRGRMSVAEIIAMYQAEPIHISEPVILIIVNKLFERNISPEDLYEITRGKLGCGRSGVINPNMHFVCTGVLLGRCMKSKAGFRCRLGLPIRNIKSDGGSMERFPPNFRSMSAAAWNLT